MREKERETDGWRSKKRRPKTKSKNAISAVFRWWKAKLFGKPQHWRPTRKLLGSSDVQETRRQINKHSAATGNVCQSSQSVFALCSAAVASSAFLYFYRKIFFSLLWQLKKKRRKICWKQMAQKNCHTVSLWLLSIVFCENVRRAKTALQHLTHGTCEKLKAALIISLFQHLEVGTSHLRVQQIMPKKTKHSGISLFALRRRRSSVCS